MNGRIVVRRVLVPLAAAVLLGTWAYLRSAEPDPAGCTRIETFAGREECLRDILVAKTREGGPGFAAAELDDILAAHPSLRDVCHQPSHAVAVNHRTATEQEMTGYLDDVTMHVCDWGVVHGLLDRYAAGKDTEDVVRLLGHCAGVGEIGMRAGCADSVGHALYETVGDFDGAAGACARHPDVLEACVSGVFMQFYSPVAPSGKGDQLGSALPVAELPALCELPDAAVENACRRATFYAYSQILGPVRYRMSKSDDPGEVFVGEFLPVYREGVDFCLGHPEPGGKGCLEELSRMTLQLLLPFGDRGLLDAVCSATPDTKETFCRTVAANLDTP